MAKCDCCADKKVSAFFCPKCKSTNVYHPFKVSNLFGLIPKWRCRNCGYEALQFPLLVTSEKQLKEVKKSKKVSNKIVKKAKKVGGRK